MSLKDLTCYTGIIEGSLPGRDVLVKLKDKNLKECWLGAGTTQFLGQLDNQLAMDSLFPGLTVNVFLPKGSNVAKYASPNWR